MFLPAVFLRFPKLKKPQDNVTIGLSTRGRLNCQPSFFKPMRLDCASSWFVPRRRYHIQIRYNGWNTVILTSSWRSGDCALLWNSWRPHPEWPLFRKRRKRFFYKVAETGNMCFRCGQGRNWVFPSSDSYSRSLASYIIPPFYFVRCTLFLSNTSLSLQVFLPVSHVPSCGWASMSEPVRYCAKEILIFLSAQRLKLFDSSVFPLHFILQMRYDLSLLASE